MGREVGSWSKEKTSLTVHTPSPGGILWDREAQWRAAGPHQYFLMSRMRETGTGGTWRSAGFLGISCEGPFYLREVLLQPAVPSLLSRLQDGPGNTAHGCVPVQGQSACVCPCNTCSEV